MNKNKSILFFKVMVIAFSVNFVGASEGVPAKVDSVNAEAPKAAVATEAAKPAEAPKAAVANEAAKPAEDIKPGFFSGMFKTCSSVCGTVKHYILLHWVADWVKAKGYADVDKRYFEQLPSVLVPTGRKVINLLGIILLTNAAYFGYMKFVAADDSDIEEDYLLDEEDND